jgi:hypothetical protein
MSENARVNRAELLDQVRELRARGLSPKQVARELGMKPAEVAPLLRQVSGSWRGAVADRPLAEPGEREVVGCWVSPGWSVGLGLEEAPEWAACDPEWADEGERAAEGEAFGTGLAGVLVARVERPHRVTICGWLVDLYCLGVKNTIGPKTVGSGGLLEQSSRFFSAFGTTPVAVPLELAQQLVHGAVAYARSFGFEPHSEFADTAPYLGPAPAACPIRFGRDGMPLYVAGPHDNPTRVIAKLEATAGRGNYHYIAPL